MALTILDYEGFGNYDLGISFYGERILFGWREDLGTRSYKFKLLLEMKSHWGECNPDEVEFVDFVMTLNLKDLPLKHIKFDFPDEPDHVVTSVDWEKFLNENQKELFADAQKRLKRKLSKKEIAPVEYTSGDFHRGDEFLVFTEETAPSWGGPFIQDGKKGCCAKIMPNMHSVVTVKDFYLLGCVEEDWSYYDLSFDSQKAFKDSNTVYRFSKQKKKLLFADFLPSERLHAAKRYLKGFENERLPEAIMPIKVWLAGNDDTTYTKYFNTVEEAEEEMKFLRKLQPLDMHKDIYERGYYFTN